MAAESAKTAEWLAAEKAFGCTFTKFVQIAAGNSSRNYCATAEDGKLYFVKFSTPKRVARIMRLMGAISSPLIPGVAFHGATAKFGGSVICALEWSEGGANVPPHLLTTAQMEAICAGYREISRALSAVDASELEGRPGLEEASRRCGVASCPIHGDFHYQNYFMRDGALSSCFDMECMRLGLPTEDLMRIFVHAIERTRCWRLFRLRTLYGKLTELVRISGYSKEAWLAALEIYRNYKCGRRAQKSSFPLVTTIDNWFRSPYYRRLRRAVCDGFS